MEEHSRRFNEIGETLHRMDRKLDDLRSEMATQFRWLIGVILTVAGAFAAFRR